MKFIEKLLDKIAEYLPDDEPATEQERVYEEGKKRVYEMHQKEKNLFYADQAWIEKDKGKIFGEIANGSFLAGDKAVMVDVHGNPLMEIEILNVEPYSEDREESEWAAKKYYLIFDVMNISGQEDFFVQTCYVIK